MILTYGLIHDHLMNTYEAKEILFSIAVSDELHDAYELGVNKPAIECTVQFQVDSIEQNVWVPAHPSNPVEDVIEYMDRSICSDIGQEFSMNRILVLRTFDKSINLIGILATVILPSATGMKSVLGESIRFSPGNKLVTIEICYCDYENKKQEHAAEYHLINDFMILTDKASPSWMDEVHHRADFLRGNHNKHLWDVTNPISDPKDYIGKSLQVYPSESICMINLPTVDWIVIDKDWLSSHLDRLPQNIQDEFHMYEWVAK